ncbi:MAG: DUF4870 domain-containing protein [Verrucomicrobia bacterium]|nr:DUF4870 domain-containing protein [Verrucomicrobiota bacterium]
MSNPTNPYIPSQSVADKTERGWAMATHLASLSAYLGNGIGGIIGPLIVWLIKRDTMPLVDDQGKEALNINISNFVYILCCIPLVFAFGLGILLMFVIGIFHLVFTIVAAVKAYEGESYRYPLTIRFIK